MLEQQLPSTRARDFAAHIRPRLSGIRRALPAAVICAGIAVAAAACSSNSPTSSGGSAPSASSGSVASYVATVCTAASQFETAAAAAIVPGSGGQSPTPPAGTPGGRRGGIASAVAQPAAAFASAVAASNPPSELKAYNDQLVSQINQIVSDIQNGTPVGGGPGGPGAGLPPASRTPRTGSPVPPQQSSGPPRSGLGGGVASLFLQGLPTPPAAVSAALTQAVAANADCQSTGFNFGLGQ